MPSVSPGLTYNQAFGMLAKAMGIAPQKLRLLHPEYDIDDYLAGRLQEWAVTQSRWAELDGRQMSDLAVSANPEEGMGTFQAMVVSSNEAGGCSLQQWEVSMQGVIRLDG